VLDGERRLASFHDGFVVFGDFFQGCLVADRISPKSGYAVPKKYAAGFENT
jgi:hypothetical protein